MNKKEKGKNDIAWEILFEKYDIVNQVERKGEFTISSDQIKEFREPRLMVKFDHRINLPTIFRKNNLSILPITRGSYSISNYDVYSQFKSNSNNIYNFAIPNFLESLDNSNIPSEAIAINCAIASGIMGDFLKEDILYATVSGRMSSDKFDFNIRNNKTQNFSKINVENSQIEIDGAYEGLNSLALIEAKIDISEDFLVRQLYYPYRVWNNRVNKRVRPVFLVYSNGIFSLYEYRFNDSMIYNSLELVQNKNYSITDYEITTEDITNIIKSITVVNEPKIPFPQADVFERIINMCELLVNTNLTRDEVTNEYAFDIRQTNYYTDAARYLGLINKNTRNGEITYELTHKGRTIMNSTFKRRQLELIRCILEHKVYHDCIKVYFDCGIMPNKAKIVDIMKQSDLYEIRSDETFGRRASTISGWLSWIAGVINGE